VLDPSLQSTIGGEAEKAKTDFVQFCGGYVFFYYQSMFVNCVVLSKNK